MSRNTQYEFVNVSDSSSLIASLTAAYEKITGTTVQPSSPEKLFIQWMAYILLLERAHTNEAGNANLASRAEGDDLDELGDVIYNCPRPDPTPSTVTEKFTISEAQEHDILIPKGTRVTTASQTYFWATDEDVYITAGETTANVACTCQTSGTLTNGYEAGQINKAVDVFEYYLSCENITASDGGSDSPDDDTYYELMTESLNGWSTAGARGGYNYFAKQVSSEIADVVAKSPKSHPGCVYIYVLMKDGSLASDEIKKEVLEACSDDYRRPLTDFVSIHDADQITYNVKFTYYIPSDTTKSATQMAQDVQDAVSEYVEWQDAKFGRDINPDKLRDLVLDVGIKRLVVEEPAFTPIPNGLGEDDTVPAVAKIGTITITNGGYEDE